MLYFRYDGVVFKGYFTFYTLEPGSKYEVRVQAKNEEGWSEIGRSFMFTTPEFDMEETFMPGLTNKAGRFSEEGVRGVVIVIPLGRIFYIMYWKCCCDRQRLVIDLRGD